MSDVLLAGASGLIGREVQRQWTGPGTLHCLLRTPQAAAPHVQVHRVDYAALPALPRATGALCCLGTTIKTAGSQAAFRAVDFDAVLHFAQAAQRAGVQRLAVVSALGANPKSGNFYSRVKGEMEAALMAMGFSTLVIARPSLLAGDRASLGQPLRRGEVWTLALTRPLAPLIPAAWRPIEAATVARAMLHVLNDARPGTQVLSSARLQSLGST
jgi:uncharacterized protein YbjT (DUF2867 family)